MPLVAAAILVGLVGLLTVSQIHAQRPAAPQTPRNGVAVVDVFAIVQGSTKIKQAKDSLTAEIEAKKESFQKESNRGKALTEKFRTLPPNSPDREKLEREILKMKADFELQGKKFERDSQEKQTKVWYSLSRDLLEEVDKFAKSNGIQLVLRSEPPQPELTDPQAIGLEIRKLIVYQRGMDVTPSLVDAVNRRPAGVLSTARAPAPPAKPAER
jgi:Skp family chaperone for outer membrane proteins